MLSVVNFEILEQLSVMAFLDVMGVVAADALMDVMHLKELDWMVVVVDLHLEFVEVLGCSCFPKLGVHLVEQMVYYFDYFPRAIVVENWNHYSKSELNLNRYDHFAEFADLVVVGAKNC